MVGVTPGLRKIYLISVTLFLLAGCSALGVGVYFMSTPFMRRKAILTTPTIWVGISVGIVMIASSLLGFSVTFSRSKARSTILVFNFLIMICIVFTLCLGAYVWFQTLNVRTAYSDRWQSWEDGLKDAFQSNDKCCGYSKDNYNPAISATCTQDVVLNGLYSYCEENIFTFVSSYLRNIYTVLFAYTAVDVLTMLAALMLDQTLKDQFRYEKSVAKMINLHNISLHQEHLGMGIQSPRRSLLPNSSMHNFSVIHNHVH